MPAPHRELPGARGTSPEVIVDGQAIRYDLGMTTKIAISLPDEQVAAARQAVAEGRAPSVSAYIAKALADQGEYADLSGLLADMAAEQGTPSDEDRAWARRALGLEEA